MPTIPGLLQLPASIGTFDRAKVAAVRPVSPQSCPAGVAIIARTLARRVHVFPVFAPSSAVPPLVSAMSWPPEPEASASGASARPGVTGPAADQLTPSLLVAASGENVRS